MILSLMIELFRGYSYGPLDLKHIKPSSHSQRSIEQVYETIPSELSFPLMVSSLKQSICTKGFECTCKFRGFFKSLLLWICLMIHGFIHVLMVCNNGYFSRLF
uniref:Uncharacterized protein n=1 Tax=Opuntia streptacantha TaxID=393608 RepID=A0A7C8Z4Q9_OPUST